MRHRRFAAQAWLPHPPTRVYAFLAEHDNHRALQDRYLRLDQLNHDGRGGRITIGMPLGLRRTAQTTVTTARRPRQLGGTAQMGRQTTARVNWIIERRVQGTSVELKATVVAASKLDTLQLALGGSWWLRRRFKRVLHRLAEALSPGDPDRENVSGSQRRRSASRRGLRRAA